MEKIGESLHNHVVKSLGSPIKHQHLVADKKQIQFSELTGFFPLNEKYVLKISHSEANPVNFSEQV